MSDPIASEEQSQISELDSEEQQEIPEKQARVYANLLPLVTRYNKKPLKKKLPDLTFEHIPRYMTGFYMDKEEPTPLVFKPDVGSSQEFRYPHSYIRAQLAVAPLSKLKAGIAYLILNGIMTNPQNFVGFYKAKRHTGAEDILLHEIFKEPEHVQEALFQILYNLKSYDAHAARDEYDPVSRETKKVNLNTPAFNYKRPENLPDYAASSKDRHYLEVDDDGRLFLFVNSGEPVNDPDYYVDQPVRIVTGLTDGRDNRRLSLCGADMERFFARTANERKTVPELAHYGEQRFQLAKYARRLCPMETRSERMLDIIRHRYDPSQPIPLDQEQVNDLARYGDGWTSVERIRKAYPVAEGVQLGDK